MSSSAALTLQLKHSPSRIHRWPSATSAIIVNDSSECFDKTSEKQPERLTEKMLLFSAVCRQCCVRRSKCCPLCCMKDTACGSVLGISKASKAMLFIYVYMYICVYVCVYIYIYIYILGVGIDYFF